MPFVYPRKEIARFLSHVTSLNFKKSVGNISETVQDRDIVAMED